MTKKYTEVKANSKNKYYASSITETNYNTY